MTGNSTGAKLIRWATAAAALAALIGLVGVGFDEQWGVTVSVVACTIALVGVVLTAVGVPIRRAASPGRR